MPVVARGDVDNQAGCHKELESHKPQHESSARIRPPNSSARLSPAALVEHILHEVERNS